MAGKSVAQKMFMKPKDRVAALDAPPGYRTLVGPLPEGVVVVPRIDDATRLVHAFVRDRAQLETTLGVVAKTLPDDATLWISYPKGGSGVPTDVNRDVARRLAQGHGLAAVSQVAVDETWSALRFKRA